MVDIEVLNVNADLKVADFDDDGANEMTLGSHELSGLVVGSISTLAHQPFLKALQPQTPQT
jgi:hypothetical protein